MLSPWGPGTSVSGVEQHGERGMSKVSQAGRPVYKQELAAIGWYFDHNRSRGVFVAEIHGGYLGKASSAEQVAETRAEGLSFPRAELSNLIHRAAMGTT